MSVDLRLGDCLEIMRNIPDKSIDLIIADPPYITMPLDWDKKEVFCSDHVREFKRILKDCGNLYVWCGIGEKSQSLIRWFPIISEYFYFKDLVTWKKARGNGNRRGWLYTREEIMWFVLNNKSFVWNVSNQYSMERRKRDGGKDIIRKSQNGRFAKSLYKRHTNVWTDIPESTFDITHVIGHDTPKPILAMERIILAHTIDGDVVLDPFMGSGTTGIACVKNNRSFIGIEIKPEYFDIVSKRITTAQAEVVAA